MCMKMAIKLNHRPSTIYVLICLLNSDMNDYVRKKKEGSYDAGLQEKLTVFVISTYFIGHVNIWNFNKQWFSP